MNALGNRGRRSRLLGLFLLAVPIVFILSGPPASAAQTAGRPGSLDPGFGTRGVALTGFAPAPVNGYLLGLSPKPDGSALAFGSASDRFAIARFGPEGSVDTSYGSDGFATGGAVQDGKLLFPSYMVEQSDGKVVAVGTTDIIQMTGIMIRFNADGSIDQSFGDDGVVKLESDARQLAVDSQDRLVIVTPQTSFYRYLPSGKPDRSFGNDGSAAVPAFNGSSGFSGMAVVGDRITLTSPFEGVLRLKGDGSVDTGFSSDGIYETEARAMFVQPDGRTVTVSGSGSVTRLLNNGTPDPGFGTGGTATVASGAGNAITVDAEGRVLVGGITVWLGEGSPRDFEAFRLTAGGQLDPGFGGDGIVTTDLAPFEGSASGSEDTITSISALPDGRVLAAGNSRHNLTLQSFALVRYTEGGDLDPTYGDGTGVVVKRPTIPSDDRAFDVLAGADRSLTVIGRSGASSAFAKYSADGKPFTTFGDGGKFSTALIPSAQGEMAESGASLPGGGQLVCSSSSQGSALARLGAEGAVDEGFGAGGVVSLPGLRRCYSTLVDTQGRILVGGVGSDNVAKVARFSEDGEPDGSYGDGGLMVGPQLSPSGGGLRRAAFDLAPNGDLLMAGDRFGATVARFTGQGKPRLSFGTKGVLKLDGFRDFRLRMAKAASIDVTPTGRIVIGGTNRGNPAIVKLKAGGSPVKSFGKGGLVSRSVLEGGSVEDLRVQANGTIVAVGAAHGTCVLANLYCFDQVLLLRYRGDGKPDLSFGRKGVVVRKFGVKSKASAVLVGSKFITIAGYAETSLDRQQFLIARFRR